MKSIRILALFSIVCASTALADGAQYTATYVDTLLQPYFKMHQGLSSDNLAASQAAAKDFAAAMEKAPADPGFTATNGNTRRRRQWPGESQ